MVCLRKKPEALGAHTSQRLACAELYEEKMKKVMVWLKEKARG